MARRVRVDLEDDLVGGPAAETVAFALDGRAYEIDLSAENAQALRDAFAPWMSAARKMGASKRVIDLRTKASRRSGDTAAIRAWAVEQGIPVKPRGRISRELRARYDAEH
jgi:hypothetical protein